MTDNVKRYILEYKDKNYKRVPLDVRIDEYKQIQEAANKSGEKVAIYIKNAIRQRMVSEGCYVERGDD